MLGMNQELGLIGNQFSVLGSLFYVGQLVYQVSHEKAKAY